VLIIISTNAAYKVIVSLLLRELQHDVENTIVSAGPVRRSMSMSRVLQHWTGGVVFQTCSNVLKQDPSLSSCPGARELFIHRDFELYDERGGIDML
jgi:hypothetical protein